MLTLGALKVFVGLYQVLTGMSTTLLIQYPVLVEEFFAWVRSFVNFDFFSIPVSNMPVLAVDRHRARFRLVKRTMR